MSIQLVNSVAEGLDVLDKERNILVTYIPLKLSMATVKLRDDIIRANKSYTLRGYEPDPVGQLRGQYGESTDLLPIDAADSNLPPMQRMLLRGGADFESMAGHTFKIECGRRDLEIRHFAVQGNHNQAIQVGHHQDQSDLTISVYLQGKGLKYRLPEGKTVYDRECKPVITMHRGKLHMGANGDPLEAVFHSGHSYEEGETRASFHIGLSNLLSAMSYDH